MRIRWIAVAAVVGIVTAWLQRNSVEAYITIFGCMALYSLRKIELEVVKAVENQAIKDPIWRHFLTRAFRKLDREEDDNRLPPMQSRKL